MGSNRIGVTSLNLRDHVTSSVTLPFPIAHFLLVVGGPLEPAYLSVMITDIFNGDGEYHAPDEMTLDSLYAKVKVIHFGTNRFLIGCQL